MLTAREARPARRIVHFWPGEGDPNLQEGVILACRGPRPSPVFSTAETSDVTCKRCRVTRVFREFSAYYQINGRSRILSPSTLEVYGLLEADAPPPLVPPAPYRNPELDKRDPLLELVDTWRELAAGNVKPAGGPLSGEVRRAYGQCAAELEDRIATMRQGGF